jgi:hypothetical protein
LAKLDCDTSNTCCALEARVSPGHLTGVRGRRDLGQPTARLGSPRTENLPPSHTMSAADASSRWRGDPHGLVAHGASSDQAALPPMAAVRLPYVPPPCGRAPCRRSDVDASASTPRRFADQRARTS